MSFRVGIGFDIHRLVEGRKLVLGGVVIDYPRGLLGHSDGDVIIHAICDAILGAIARSDIGELYPDTDGETEGMNSLDMLREIISTVRGIWRVINIDINCICEKPKLSGYREEMIRHIAGVCMTDASRISVKFRTHEGLGEIGEGKAIASQAVVLMEDIKTRGEDL